MSQDSNKIPISNSTLNKNSSLKKDIGITQDIQQQLQNSDLYLTLNVRSRTKTFFQGKVKSVTAINKTGLFDILPLHANFITLVSKYLIIDKGTPTEKKIEFYSAVVSVMGTRVDVYVGV